VAAVMFLYQITVFLQQNTTASLLELYFDDSMQLCTRAAAPAAAVAVRGRRLGRCSIYRHRTQFIRSYRTPILLSMDPQTANLR